MILENKFGTRVVSSNTREITSYLKGFAISSVLVNHYINMFVADGFGGYGGTIVGLFFVLSGYGIFFSLQKDFEKGETTRLTLKRYFYKRAIRILPLHWLAALPYLVKNKITIISLIVPLVCSPYWFIPQIIQCYFVAPLFYFLLKRCGLVKYIFIILILLFTANKFFDLLLVDLSYSRYFSYTGVFLGNLFLFALGIALPKIVSKYKLFFTNNMFCLISFVIYLFCVWYTRNPKTIFYLSKHIHGVANYIFMISSFVFCCYVITTVPPLPLKKMFILLGNYSYSIYLFHPLFYNVLYELGIVRYGSLQSIIFTLLLFPLFTLICMVAEKETAKFLTRLPLTLRKIRG